MTVLRRAVLALIASVALLAVSTAPASAAPSDQDTAWMVAAHQSNLAEIAAGQAAEKHATTDEVREMGSTLIKDHKKLDADLTAVADRFGVDLPGMPSPAQRAALKQVMAQEGSAFDAAWIASQIDGHQATVMATKKELTAGQDPTVLALAKAATPVVQGHLDHLRQVAEEQGVPTSVPTGLDGPDSAAALGGALIGAGLLFVAASLMLVRRRRA